MKKTKVKKIKDDQYVQGVIQIVVKWELILWQVCLEYEDGVSPHVYLQDINMMKNEEMKFKIKMGHLEEIICLKIAILIMIMDMGRHARTRGSPVGVWGSNLQVFL